jgi:hypothetical protein
MRQKIIESTHGERVYVSYTFDDQPVVHAEIINSSAELACKYQFAIKELELIVDYLQLLTKTMATHIKHLESTRSLNIINIDPQDALLIQGIFSAATISYGKIFSSTGKRRMQFPPRFFFEKAKRFEPLHTWWMEIRHAYIAHSNHGPYDEAKVAILLQPNTDDNSWWWCFPHVRFRRTAQPHTIEDLTTMTKFMLDLMLERQNKLIKHIANNLNKKILESCRQTAVYASPCEEIPSSPSIN